jgi:6-phospho-beta-glucosidase
MSGGMKLAILGGGSFRVPYVYQALLRDRGEPRIDQVWLYDPDETRLATMARILSQVAQGFADAPKITVSTSLHDSVEGSAFVFSALRVGGLSGRVQDERVALRHGVLGQETTGAGGLAFAIRTIPVMLDIAAVIRDLAPDAYLINFTNPAGIVTEAVQSVLGSRVVGICDGPSGLGRRIASALDIPQFSLGMDYVGLNHLGWMRGVYYRGENLLPLLLADDCLLEGLEEAAIFGTEWIRMLGCIPNEYLYYYYFNRDVIHAISSSPQTRGEFLMSTQNDFFAAAGKLDEDAASVWNRAVNVRRASYMAEATGGVQGDPKYERVREADPAQQGYAGVALAVMNAISRAKSTTLILNVRNGSTIAGLPEDAVVEVPSLVDANGAHPLATAAPDLYQLGLMQQVKATERAIIEAAVTGSRQMAITAFALHPLVDSVSVARELVEGYIENIPEVAAVLGH